MYLILLNPEVTIDNNKNTQLVSKELCMVVVHTFYFLGDTMSFTGKEEDTIHSHDFSIWNKWRSLTSAMTKWDILLFLRSQFL